MIFKHYIQDDDRDKQNDEWVYGWCNGFISRRHKAKGNVQFVLFKKGEAGHSDDYWHDFDKSWWNLFF